MPAVTQTFSLYVRECVYEHVRARVPSLATVVVPARVARWWLVVALPVVLTCPVPHPLSVVGQHRCWRLDPVQHPVQLLQLHIHASGMEPRAHPPVACLCAAHAVLVCAQGSPPKASAEETAVLRNADSGEGPRHGGEFSKFCKTCTNNLPTRACRSAAA